MLQIQMQHELPVATGKQMGYQLFVSLLELLRIDFNADF